MQLTDICNLKNALNLIKKLKEITITETIKLAHLTKKTYTNIPTKQAIQIIENILENYHQIFTKQKEVHMIPVQTVTEQNYFHFMEQYCKQKGSPTVGTPTSAILVQILIQ